jgi:hypothetical protein
MMTTDLNTRVKYYADIKEENLRTKKMIKKFYGARFCSEKFELAKFYNFGQKNFLSWG